ncbi:MAG: Rne/Rng family ribonuclease [Geminicoccaceae bacterium]
MTKRMLIDATHTEETRVVVLDDHHLVDFDFESSTKRQLKGNIYLAKITRVEPSLQAAFVEYGGNRHGFLAFSEIHPDYYQIPQADREYLAQLERDAQAKAAAEPDPETGEHAGGAANGNGGDSDMPVEVSTDADEETADMVDEQARRRARLLRSYKIQEVIKRRQIMLVQVVKEERGNKGAALTTYLSLAGRYCVLMPNTPRGGGISRKIASNTDRRRLKDIAHELEVPHGMGLIIRTAGQERTKAEIRRDYDYLLRLWNEIRETTLQSIAPKLIYEEGDLIKRAMRDIYTRDVEEVLVEGDEGYKSAKRLMTMLMPSKARIVKPYKDDLPLFFKFKVEDQLDAMHSPVVHLPSGGSIVIHTTEALTAIDVNSGRSTRERHIDETAVKTNLEAADEIARQLRLRDLAGLVVIDFIDMSEGRHQRAVERRLREALKTDRARLQVGKISMFGLLELSRQRLRPSLLELSSQMCPVCQGQGVVRSTESCALQALRRIQEEGIRGEAAKLHVRVPIDVALYVLNHKRESVARLEERYGMSVYIAADSSLTPSQWHIDVIERREAPEIERAPEEAVERPERRPEPRQEGRHEGRHDGRHERAPQPQRRPERQPERQPERVAAEVRPGDAAEEAAEDGARRRKRRRRRRRRGGDQPGMAPQTGAPMAAEGYDEVGGEDESEVDEAAIEVEVPGEPVEAAPAELPEPEAAAGEPVAAEPAAEVEPVPAVAEAAAEVPVVAEEAPKPKRRVRKPRKAAVAETVPAPAEAAAAEATNGATVHDEPEPVAAPASEPVTTGAEEPVPVAAQASEPEAEPTAETAPAWPETLEVTPKPDRPARQGWWSRLRGL